MLSSISHLKSRFFYVNVKGFIHIEGLLITYFVLLIIYFVIAFPKYLNTYTFFHDLISG